MRCRAGLEAAAFALYNAPHAVQQETPEENPDYLGDFGGHRYHVDDPPLLPRFPSIRCKSKATRAGNAATNALMLFASAPTLPTA